MMKKTLDCIVIAIGGHWDSKSAISLQFKAVADELVMRGHQVILLIPGQQEAKQQVAGNPLVFTWPSKRPTQLSDAFFLYRLLRRYHPTCVIANFAAVNWMILIGRMFGIPVRIAWNHTPTEAIDLDWTGSDLRKELLRFRKRIIYSMATTVVPVSFFLKEDLKEKFKIPQAKCEVFYNAIQDPRTVWISSDSLRGNQVIVCPGRLYHAKGQDILVRAIGILHEGFPNLRAEFLGDGPNREELISLAEQLGVSENCHFAGWTSRDALLERISRACLTVVPSRSEAFGLVNIESMSVGIPVIASKVGGIPEIIRDGIDGYLIPPNDASVLAEKIMLLITDPDLCSRMGANARQRFLNLFELQGAVEKQVNWLEMEIRNRTGSTSSGQ